MKRKTYKFRIYPNRNQETALIFTLNTCRHLYNAALAKRKHEGDINRLYREFDIFPWGKLQIQKQELPELTPVEMFVGTSAKQEASSERGG
jgi:transposase